MGRTEALIVCAVILSARIYVTGSADAERLYIVLMKDYNKMVRPVPNNNGILNVSMGVKLAQLIGVDEVNQVITTNVIVRQTWNDYKLIWNPESFGGITHMDIPSEVVWRPDIVLYNNADGNYQITMMSKVTVKFTGEVVWDPPAIYKSYCMINVQYFPYDKQSCDMKFGSWTYDGWSLNLLPIRGYQRDNKKIDIGMDLSEYKQSIEWDILEASANRHLNFYPCCREPYLDITFTIVIRRKALFYTVNLISPCVAISFLTVFVFYLPSDSGEKVTLCISILLSLTVFFLLLAEIIPPTSLEIPLIGKYLLFTMFMVTMSIVVTIIVLNIHFRNPSTHKMRPWVRRVFIEILPKLLQVERPSGRRLKERLDFRNGVTYIDFHNEEDDYAGRVISNYPWSGQFEEMRPDLHTRILSRDVQNVVNGINFIVDQVRDKTTFAYRVQDWKYVALVLDRLFLWVFAISCLVGTGMIILDAPPLYEMDEPIPRLCQYPVIPGSDDSWICLFKTDDDSNF